MIDLARILRPPRYGYERDGRFYRPSAREILREYFYNLNVFRDRREWINVCNVLTHWGLLVPFVLTFTVYASVAHFAELAAYVVYLNVFGTVFLHRYGAHRAFRFSGCFPRFLVRNMAPKLMIEELFTVSHVVHHSRPEKPGDPYCALGGWL